MSTVVYRYNQDYKFTKKGVKHSIHEEVTDGTSTGLKIRFHEKTGEKFYRITVQEVANEKNKFTLVEEKDGTTEPEKIITDKELLKILKDNKLETIINFFTKERGTYKGIKLVESSTVEEKKKVLKKTLSDSLAGGEAKKSPKKASKKVSKKVSKKASKKVSKKASKKVSKKASKKASKKVSKKSKKI
jgi:hypothetical protein